MKKLLVLNYSQSGQLDEILDYFLKPIADSGKVELVYETIQPVDPYPFPWDLMTFIDAMPESVRQIPCRLKPFSFDPDENFDAIILAYQVWYLSPSIPITAFLQSKEAARVLRNKPVVTIIGCRNMWLNAHEIVKKQIVSLQGIPVGNIALIDRASNLVSIATIMYWMLTGKKKRFLKLFPKPGVDDQEVKSTDRFGEVLLPHILESSWDELQDQLRQLGAVYINPSFIFFERRLAKIFNLWARFIRRKGGPKAQARRLRLRLFIGYLLTAIIVLAPIAGAMTFVIQKFSIRKIKKFTEYYAGNRYERTVENNN